MDYSQILIKKYPDGSIGGQCGIFCHKLMQFPSVGNTIGSKRAAVKKFGYPAAKVQGGYVAGDVLILDIGTVAGHVAFINNIIGDDLQLTESNWFLNQRVHHDRLINKFSPEIVGCIRGQLLFL